MTDVDTQSVSIVGTGISAFARERPGRTIVALAIEAILAALNDAGVERADVDGLMVTPTGRFHSSRIGYSIGEHLGMYPRRISANNDGGSAATGLSLDIARWAILEGRCKYVVMVDAGKWSEVGFRGFQEWTLDRDRSVEYVSTWGRDVDPDQNAVWGGTWVGQAALLTERHMADWGTTPTQLASVATAARHNAGLNPDAVHRQALSVDDVLTSPLVSSPLHRLMCSTVNDGAAAVVLTRTDRAKGLSDSPVQVLGSSSGFGGASLTQHFASLCDVSQVGARAAAAAFGQAGVEAADVDVACWSDPFATATIMALADYGFCKQGEAGAFVEDQSRITVGGSMPLNTHGGHLSGTMAAGDHANLVELVRQLQGRCDRRQVSKARVGFFASTGQWRLNHSVAVLGVS